MFIEQLRKQHPRLIYQDYNYHLVDRELKIQFQFLLEPQITFAPKLSIPLSQIPEQQAIENFVFHLGLIELISYWKAACPPEIVINPGNLSPEQIQWWQDLFKYGLGEFYYQNNIDFTAKDFLTIKCSNQETIPQASISTEHAGNLIMVGGGKDSTVTLEILKQSQRRRGTFVLNPIRASLDSIKIAGYEPPIVVKRTIDSQLIALNKAGYLNGHTPFSAYLAFLGTFIAALYGYENIIASNESSAEEQNTIFHQLKVNHQYSKSFRFEKLFRQYCAKYLTPKVSYFSFLRPLLDLQISSIFSRLNSQHLSFRSCNVNQRKDSWCKQCPKCAFVYLSLFPFLSYEQTLAIFGEDLYYKFELEEDLKALAGIGDHKPFECVGTIEESRLALAMSWKKYAKMDKPIPPVLLEIKQNLEAQVNYNFATSFQQFSHQWNNDNCLPEEHAKLLKKALDIGTKVLE